MQTSSNLSGKNYCNSGLQKVIKPDLPHKEHRCQLMGIRAMKLLMPSPSHKILITLFLLWYCHHNLLLFSSKKEDILLCRAALPPACSPREGEQQGSWTQPCSDYSCIYSVTLIWWQGGHCFGWFFICCCCFVFQWFISIDVSVTYKSGFS